ncbi:hypothetical protein PoMZ_03350 [Pyricularia oryzae]|uniref:Uncharacterized protein n=1 Tax=Pyricularia oryzae TaxID=318829 RepID=A0A4P7N712_PYROR|nr:hypothetical protein PoMZ_03350 [Pyricularia oryzae]
MASDHTHFARTLSFNFIIRVDQVFWQYCRGKNVILVIKYIWNLAFICNRGGEVFELVYKISIGSISKLRVDS